MQILYLILGLLLATIGVPFLDSISAVISFITELIKAKISVKIAQYNAEITKLTENNSEEEISTRAIGFVMPTSEETFDENENED